jgi:hypothetical protein
MAKKVTIYQKYYKINNCIDCKKLIDKYAIRCNSCARKYLHLIGILNVKGKNHPNYKRGFFSDNRLKCKDCLKILGENASVVKTNRCRSCSKKGRFNGNYANGKSREPYTLEFNERLKESIRKRDHCRCQLCSKTQKQQIKQLKKKLSVHHIDYNKENCKEDNLITLCLKCNNIVNKHRNWWKFIFHLMINYILENKCYVLRKD